MLEKLAILEIFLESIVQRLNLKPENRLNNYWLVKESLREEGGGVEGYIWW